MSAYKRQNSHLKVKFKYYLFKNRNFEVLTISIIEI